MLAVIGALLATSFAVQAQDAPEVRIGVEPQTATIGDPLTVVVSVEAPAGHEAIIPGEDADIGGAEIRSAEQSVEPRGGGAQRHIAEYTAVVWEVGEATLTSPAIAIRGPDGEMTELERAETAVTIRSVLPEGAQEIREIRGPREMPLLWWHYALAALPVLALLGLIALGVWWLRRRRGADEVAGDAPAPQLPPAEEALEALRALQDEDLPGEGRIKEHYVRLSWILRNYVERRWHLPALEETTGMLRHTMLGSGRIDDGIVERIIEVQRSADLAKFAKHRPQANIAMADLVQVRDIVYATRPGEGGSEDAAHESALPSPAS
jgi:hypothetical protein